MAMVCREWRAALRGGFVRAQRWSDHFLFHEFTIRKGPGGETHRANELFNERRGLTMG